VPPASRVGDPTIHPGALTGPGVPTVLIGGQPAAVLLEQHTCASSNPHPPTAAVKGSATVLIGGRPALRMGDCTACGASIVGGVPNVLIGG
jgi:uncharacterized Zn-binding protein involved in type VI secretion